MPGAITGVALGALARGALVGGVAGFAAIASHAIAGGAVEPARAWWVVTAAAIVGAIALVALPAAWRRRAPVGVLLAVPVAAHPLLETGHASHATTGVSSGLAGVVGHALSPGMLMFALHLLGLVASVVVVALASSVARVWAQLGLRPAGPASVDPTTVRGRVVATAPRAHSFLIRGRAPPLAW